MTPVRRLPALAAMVLLLATPSSGPAAHDWYPRDCCADGDCHMVEVVGRDEAGRMVARVGSTEVVVPADLAPRLSPDGHIHVCYEPGDLGIYVRCVFLPPPS